MRTLFLIVALVCAVLATAMGFDWIHDEHALAWLCAASVFFITAHLPLPDYFR